MFKEQYNQLNNQVCIDKNLLQDTICKAEILEKKSNNKLRSIRKPAIALISICLCLSLAMPILASKIESIYNLMYMISPDIAQFFMPVQKSDEDNGVKMEVVSAYIHDNVAEVYITMQDLTEDRIDETTDLFDSYSINRPFGSSAHCEFVGYDKSTKTATFLITIEQLGNKDIAGDKITFTVREFLSHKQIFNDIEIPLSLSSVGIAKKTQIPSTIRGYGGIQQDQFDKENPIALVPSPPMNEFPVKGIDLTGIGYIDGKLHIQTSVINNLEKDNHGFFYLKDNNGNKIDCIYNFYFVNQYDQTVEIDYSNYVFDIPQREIANYTLHGYFVTSGKITKGEWKVTFPLERQK